ncbi:7TM diverse intracellular signaling domain-containing protein [Robertmurraya sp.]|uniref:sensor domain-containing diguanylate cyclase n=1 Tax=Robertmurraya sp. TaxID=2837525 RepID=UPI0037048C8E
MQTLHGIFYGIMLAMIIYNSFLFLSLREKSYLYYILFIIGFTLMQSIWDGFAFQWLWGDYPWWAMRSNSFFIVWTSLFSLQFAKHFLMLKTDAPLLYKVVSTFIIFCAVALVLPFVLNIRTATMVSTILASIAIIFILAIALKVRFTSRESKYFVAAWSLLLVGVLLNICAAYQLLPLNAVTLYAPKIGILVEVMVLSLGLADKIKRITLEKEQETRNVQTFKQSAMYDHLTNLLNRKYFLESSQETLSLAKGSNQQVSLMLIDIDHFKNINDTYGHTIGDQAIVFVANQIQKVCNNCGIVGRYGGEEFIVFLNQLDLHSASQIAEELIELHRRVPFMLENGHSIYLTLSIGLCSNDFQEYKNVNEMILHADHSLYYAKNNGRDQVAIYG